jgi:hypothetical protein
MKKAVSPVAIMGLIVITVVVLAVFGYRALQPAPYAASPGSPGAAGNTPGMTSNENKPSSEALQPTTGNSYYPAAPAGSTPGKPVSSGP